MAFPFFIVLGLFRDGIAIDAPPPARQYLYISIDQGGVTPEDRAGRLKREIAASDVRDFGGCFVFAYARARQGPGRENGEFGTSHS